MNPGAGYREPEEWAPKGSAVRERVRETEAQGRVWKVLPAPCTGTPQPLQGHMCL